MIRKRKHHGADEDDENDRRFTSSDGPSPDKSVSSGPMKFQAIRVGSSRMNPTEIQVGDRTKDPDKIFLPTQQEKSASIGEEDRKPPAEGLWRLKLGLQL